MWSQHDIQRLRWTSLRAQYLKHEAWSETAKLTHSLQMKKPPVPKCLLVAREEKRVLLWTVIDINCMCLNFIFTGFSVGDGRGEPVRIQEFMKRKSSLYYYYIIYSIILSEFYRTDTSSKIKLQQRGTNPPKVWIFQKLFIICKLMEEK